MELQLIILKILKIEMSIVIQILFFLTPGIGLIYYKGIDQSIGIESGVNYQYVNVISDLDAIDKFVYGEISFSAGLKVNLFYIKNKPFSISSGLNGGKFLHFKWLVPDDYGWHSAFLKIRPKYSNKNYFTDLYLNLNYTPDYKKSNMVITPFIKYRFIDNWINYYIERFHYGIKIGLKLKLKK
jgi:hypothetical protein